MDLNLSPLMIAGLALAGLVVGPGLAWLARRLPSRPAPTPDPFRARYTAAAVVAAGLGLAAGLVESAGPAALVTALLGWHLLLIALVDGEHYWLPDRLTLPLLLAGFGAAAALDRLSLPDSAIGAAAGFGALWLLARGYRALRGREGLGGGDPVLLAALGAWTGWQGLPAVLLWAALAGLAVALARAATGRPMAADDRLPFGVFLALGGWLVWLFGPPGL